MSEKLSAALGMFDGLHIGHRKVIETAVNNPLGLVPAVVSFKQHPRQLLQNTSPELLMDLETKKALLAQLGVKRLILLDFKDIKNLTPTEFLTFLINKYNISMLVCGYNFRFGRKASGCADDLYVFGSKNSIPIEVVPAVNMGSHAVSSTLIRKLIKSGEIEKANAMLGRNFSFSSPVLDGDGRGRILGFPTINQNLPENFVVPKLGVYVTITHANGKALPSVTNIGFKPTFGSNHMTSETFIMDFDGDLYGKWVKIELIAYLREERKFQNIADLTAQIELDITAAKNFFKA